jgi:hypothetical protein
MEPSTFQYIVAVCSTIIPELCSTTNGFHYALQCSCAQQVCLSTWAGTHNNCPECRTLCPQAPVELYYDASRIDAERSRIAARAAVAAETLKQNLQAELAALKQECAAKEAACAELQRQNAQLQHERTASSRTGGALMVSVRVQCMTISVDTTRALIVLYCMVQSLCLDEPLRVTVAARVG